MPKSTLMDSETRLRRLFGWAFATTLVGVAASVSDDVGFGAWLTVAGLLGSVLSIHRLGRLGPDAPLRFGTLRKRRKSNST